MGVTSAGILVYRRRGPLTAFLPGHPGGPLWARKDVGAWMVPKGLIEPGEEPIEAALREFEEETGLKSPLLAGSRPCAKPAARPCFAGPPKETWTWRPSGPENLRWNGRLGQASARRFQSWIALPISPGRKPLGQSCRRKRRSSARPCCF